MSRSYSAIRSAIEFLLLAVLIVILVGSADATSFPAASSKSTASETKSNTVVNQQLTRSQIQMHSNGWMVANGYRVEPNWVNTSNGAVGYITHANSQRPDQLPVFGLDGIMGNDEGLNAQGETSITTKLGNSNVVLGGAIDSTYPARCNAAYLSSNSGASWQTQCPPYGDPQPDQINRYDPAVGWSPDDSTAYYLAESRPPDNRPKGTNILWRSTDNGITFVPLSSLDDPTTSNDRSYMWVDQTAGPRRGTVYVTYTAFDLKEAGSVNNITIRSSTDAGATWPVLGRAVRNNEDASARLEQYASLAPLPSGHAVVIWVDDGTTLGNMSGNQVIRWARTQNGGQDWYAPFNNVIADIRNDQAIPFGSSLPNKVFRTSAAPSIAADPVYCAPKAGHENQV